MTDVEAAALRAVRPALARVLADLDERLTLIDVCGHQETPLSVSVGDGPGGCPVCRVWLKLARAFDLVGDAADDLDAALRGGPDPGRGAK